VNARRVLAEKRHLIWPIVAGILINVGVFAFVVYPLAQKVAGGEQAATAATAALNAARREYSNANQMVKGKVQADAELQKFYGDVLPPDMSGARRITYTPIEQLAKQHNVRLERVTMDQKPIRESALAKFTYTAVLSGEYGNIRRFIHALETAPDFLVLENVDLTQGEGEIKGLTVNIQIATYFRMGAHGN
jgi:Tfp pilus assembly protein PilO